MSPPIRTRSRKTAEPLYVWWNPGTVIDRYGFPVNTKGEIWRLNDISRARRLNWDLSDTATDIKDSMKAYAVHSIESQGPLTIGCIAQGLRHFLSIAGRLESLQDLNYSVLEAALTKMRLLGTACKFSAVRRWYRWCTDQGLPGFQEEIAVCEDLSKGGISFRSRNQYEEGSRVEVAVPYTPGSGAIFVPIRIVFSQPISTAGLFRHGAAYIRPPVNV